MFTKRSNAGIYTILAILFTFAAANAGQSLYVLQHWNSYLRAFEIDGTELIFQKEIQLDQHGFGPIDLAIDNVSNTIFISFEHDPQELYYAGNVIELVNSRTMEPYENVEHLILDGPLDITGLEYDGDRCCLYCTDRNTNDLYVYHWDPFRMTLTPDPASPVQLSNINYACGLARNGDILYVSEYQYVLEEPGDPYQTIQCYDLGNNFVHCGEIDMGNNIIGIAYSNLDDVLYGGAFRNSTWLIKYSMFPGPTIEKNIGCYINGITTDNETGLVYVTTYRDPYTDPNNHTIEVYDTDGWIAEPNTADPDFTYGNNNTDGVTLRGLAGLEVGNAYKPPLMTLTKTDNVSDPNGTVLPNDNITYTICYAPDANDHENVVVTDYLPPTVEWVSADPNTGTYDSDARVYSWNIGHVEGGSGPAYLYLTVQVNNQCEPKGQIINRVEIESDTSYNYDFEYTPVGCWGGDIIFTDQYAVLGTQAGTSWENAYTDLQDALERARNGCGNTIWVARGIYRPGNTRSSTFSIPGGVSVYGAFTGTEDFVTFDLADRNFQANQSILNGYAWYDPMYNCDQYAYKVVTMGDETVLDGFVVNEATQYNIYCASAGFDFTIANCVITDSGQWGIYCQNCNANVSWCTIKNNGTYGINHLGSEYLLTINNCKIYDNEYDGMYSFLSIPTILNSVIHHNGSADVGYYGIKLYQPSDTPDIRNNTIAYNSNEGVFFTGENAPEITNCILWGNNENGGGFQFNEGCSVTYSCFHDPNDPNNYDSDPDANYNIHAEPNFVSVENCNYHLAYDSPCKDRGDSNLVIPGELDMDSEYRIDDTIEIVDMGADEVHCEEVSHPLDWDASGIIDTMELMKFSAAWLSIDPNYADPNQYPGFTTENWDPDCDIAGNNHLVNMNDFAALADVWLWQACWLDTGEMMGMMMMAPSGGESMSLSAASWSASAPSAKSAPVAESVPLATLEEMTAWLEEIYGDNEEFQLGYSPQEWQDFIDEVKASWYETD